MQQNFSLYNATFAPHATNDSFFNVLPALNAEGLKRLYIPTLLVIGAKSNSHALKRPLPKTALLRALNNNEFFVNVRFRHISNTFTAEDLFD